MKKLSARPVESKNLWVLSKAGKNVGLLSKQKGRYLIICDDKKFEASVDQIKDKVAFQHRKKKSVGKNAECNVLHDVKNRVTIFTKTKDSKCYYALGYFVIAHNGNEYVVEHNPKWIYINRYKHYGPFDTERDAQDKADELNK